MNRVKGFFSRVFGEDDQIVDDQGKPLPTVSPAKKPLDLRKVGLVVLFAIAALGLVLNMTGDSSDSGAKPRQAPEQKTAQITGNGADVKGEGEYASSQAEKIAHGKLQDVIDHKGNRGETNHASGNTADRKSSYAGGSGESASRLSLEKERDQAKTIVVDFTRQTQSIPAPEPTSSTRAVSAPAPTSEDRPRPIDLSDDSAKRNEQKKEKVLPESDKFTGQLYPIYEGSYLEVVVLNRINGDAAGPIVCMLTTDIYAKDQTLLAPQGTKIIGEVRSVNQQDQARLYVAFHLMRMPDGFKVNLDQFKGLSQIGDVGLRDLVNRHLLQAFGASLAVGAIGGLSQIGSGYSGLGYDPSTAIRMGIGQQMGQESIRILDRFLNRLPTIIIREGYRARIYIDSDLMVPAYFSHQMEPNL